MAPRNAAVSATHEVMSSSGRDVSALVSLGNNSRVAGASFSVGDATATTNDSRPATSEGRSLARVGPATNRIMDSHATTAEEEAAEQLLPTIARHRFKIPLWLTFIYESVLAIVTYVIIVVVTDNLVRDLTTGMITRQIASDLQLAYMKIIGPSTAVEGILAEQRDRATVERLVTGQPSCSDKTADFSASAAYLSDASLVIRAHPNIDTLFSGQQSNTETQVRGIADDGITPIVGPRISGCVASARMISTSIGAEVRTSTTAVKLTDFANLSTIEYTVSSDQPYFAQFALSSTAANWTVILSTNPALALYMVTVLPTMVNETMILDGSRLTKNLATDTLSDDNLVSSRQVIAVVGGCLDVSVLPALLQSLTPLTEGATTAIYDLRAATLVGSSVTDPNGQVDVNSWVDTSKMELWPAGESPHEPLNRAFRQFDFRAIHPLVATTVDDGTYLYTAFPFGLTGGLQLVMVQSTPRKYYYDEIAHLEKIIIIVGVVGAVAIVITCIPIGFAIRASLIEVQANMLLASAFKNERVQPSSSIFADIEELCISVDKMNLKLMAAKAFLPQSMLVDTETGTDTGGEEAEDDDEGSVSIATGHTEDRLGKGRKARGVLLPGDTESTLGTHTHTVEEAQQYGKGAKAQMAMGTIMHKRVTIMSLNVRHFHTKMINRHDPSSVVAPTRDLTELVGLLSAAEKGVIDSFHGDHFVISFNAARHNAEGPLSAVKTAMAILAKTDGDEEPSGDAAARFSMGISTGRAFVGHLGSATMKRMSIIGDVYSKAMALERMSRRMPVVESPGAAAARLAAADANSPSLPIEALPPMPTQCLIDQLMATEVQHTCQVQLLASLCCRGSNSASGPFVGLRPETILRSIVHKDIPDVTAKLDSLQGVGDEAAQKVDDNVRPFAASCPLTSSQPVGCELIFCVRSDATAYPSNGGDDEWLYQVSASEHVAITIDLVNKAIAEYLAVATPVDEARRRGGRMLAIGGDATASHTLALGVSMLTDAHANLVAALTRARETLKGSSTDSVGLEALRYGFAIAEGAAASLPRSVLPDATFANHPADRLAYYGHLAGVFNGVLTSL